MSAIQLLRILLGALWIWGSNKHGILGLGGTEYENSLEQAFPVLNPVFMGQNCNTAGSKALIDVNVGSAYMAVIDSTYMLWTWGYGGHGNLGERSSLCQSK